MTKNQKAILLIEELLECYAPATKVDTEIQAEAFRIVDSLLKGNKAQSEVDQKMFDILYNRP